MRIILLILLNFIFIKSYSTNQVSDILISNKDTLELYESPLEEILEITTKLQSGENVIEMSSDCWRGYFAEWELIDNKLFLLKVSECNSGKSLNRKIEKILGRKFVNGKIFADWVNKTYWSGKNIVPEQTLYISIFEQEYKMNFKKGELINKSEFNFKPCKYKNNEKWTEFILTNLDWNKLPKLNEKSINISIYIEPNNKGEISDVIIEHSDDNRYNSEIINTIKKSPCMTIYYNQGKVWEVGESINIKINKENFNKYVR